MILCSFSRALRSGILVLGLSLVAACGGNDRTAEVVLPASVENAPRFATGPIGAACLIHNRRVADQERCGCIQAAANLTLSQSDQQRAVRFFGEPELLQQIKLSDSPENERFWYAWAGFAETAETMCASS
ncbi:hypothetical protein [Roseobacter weihaiensis]|uniref:hypothetical protein n=1 Tax=Roseobacter weihaiensis TaxID=2763262 RepID=UPI001D0A32F4|nr:hypothetical protein [Roseobacter sp. H9]